MIKIIKTEAQGTPVKMCDMKPFEVGVIEDTDTCENGSIVMRTASRDKFEVMILSSPGLDRCWTHKTDVNVRLLAPGKKIIIELYNEPKKETK